MGIGQKLLQLLVLNSSPFSFLASDTAIPPYLDRHRWKVCSEIPCLRQISCFLAPASDSFRILMICSSVNRFRFRVSSPPLLYRKTHSRCGPFYGGEVTGASSRPRSIPTKRRIALES